MDSSRLWRLCALLLVLCLLAWINLSIGPKDVSLFHLVSELDQLIVLELRLPKVFMAISAGGLLGISGLFMQTYFQNPLVGPYILGVHSGSALGVAAWYLLSGATLGLGGVVGFSAIGSLSVLLLLIGVAPLFPHKSFLLIFGLVLGHLLSGLLSLMTLFSPSEILRGFLVWGMGSFERLDLVSSTWIMLSSLVLLIISLLLTKSLNAMMLGESYAKSLGMNLRLIKIFLISLAGLMAAIVSATCGPIAFVGVMAPHMSRWFWGELRHHWLILGSFCIGAIMCLGVQSLTLLFIPYNIPVNILLGIVSAPLMMVFLLRLRGRAYDF